MLLSSTAGKGNDTKDQRNCHSWTIVDEEYLVDWITERLHKKQQIRHILRQLINHAVMTDKEEIREKILSEIKKNEDSITALRDMSQRRDAVS